MESKVCFVCNTIKSIDNFYNKKENVKNVIYSDN